MLGPHTSSMVLAISTHGQCEAGVAGQACRATEAQGQSTQGSKAGDHLLLQISNTKLSSQKTRSGDPSDVGRFGCSGMPDVKKKCSDDGCKVLAGDLVGLSCSDYCARSGRTCVAAWEDENDQCTYKETWHCDRKYDDYTSDQICECSTALLTWPLEALAATPSRLVWSDDFDGSSLDLSKWDVINEGGGFGNNEKQYYTRRSENVRVENGILHIQAKCDNYNSHHFTSAKLTTEGFSSWGPGHRVEVRAKIPTALGTWPAIWMLPTKENYGEWPASGEIDIMEAVGCTQGQMFGTVHTGAYNHLRNTQSYGTRAIDLNAWHKYAMEWTSSGVAWYVDDELYGVFSPTHQDVPRWPFNKEFYLILNLAVGGSWGGMCLPQGTPSCAQGSDFAGNGQTMMVDYARVYQV